ncbi:hypothetical protein ACIRLA_28685 [Streptomyces sp. NPDC102364]|uniref:hypothetical protein n=1 Tax=Streptomyces sp. NPDC102364 TaxID=3366161 RepID=UPI0038092B8B
MTESARQKLAAKIRDEGENGRLVVLRDAFEVPTEGADLAPHSALTAPRGDRPPLIERVKELNAESSSRGL